MDYLNFYCGECKFHGYDVMDNGICNHPDVMIEMPDKTRACFRFKLPKRIR